MSLFNKAKEKAVADPKAGKGKTRKVVVIEDKGFHSSVKRLVTLNKEIDDRNAEAAMIQSELKQTSIGEFNKLYENEKKYPGSFEIQVVDPTAKTKELPVEWTFCPTDRYILPDKDKQAELKTLFGDEIIDSQTTYQMDAKLVEEYGDEISSLIEKSKKIPEHVKEQLIKAVVKPCVKKGTISVLKEKYGQFPVEKVIEKICPVFQVKDLHITE